MKLKNFVSLFCTGLLAVGIFSGCANGGKTTANSNQDKSEIKDELIISMGTRPYGEFDPRKRWGIMSESQIIHSTLLKKTSDLKIVGDYAKEYQVSDDGLTWTFHLNDNFKLDVYKRQ